MHRFATGPWGLVAMVATVAMTRLLPHPPNFSPVGAMALFAGAHFASRRWAISTPLAALLASDLVLAFWHGGRYGAYLGSATFWAVYSCVALSTLFGHGLRGRVGGGRVLGYALASSTMFFIVTNFVLWRFPSGLPLYPQDASGLLICYLAALPFFQWTLLGTLFHSALLFGGFALLRRHAPQLCTQTIRTL